MNSKKHQSLSCKQALRLLINGNHRFSSDKSTHPHQAISRRKEITKGQSPIAAILCCSDSRVPPEIIFDQGLGDVFVVRVAGNVVDDAVLGSIEYAAEHLHVPLVIVLGHSMCGAVAASIEGKKHGNQIDGIIKQIRPSITSSQKQSGDLIAETAKTHARRMVHKLIDSKPVLSHLIQMKKLEIIPAFYCLDSGIIELLNG
jgi:carbonic anhydrase